MTEIVGPDLRPSTTWRPPGLWWLLLAPVLVAGFLGSWFIAAGVIVVLLAYRVRPFDFVTAFLIVTSGATFLNYQHAAGSLTKQMGLLSIGIGWMLICYLLAKREEFLSVPRTQLTAAFGTFLVWSLVSAARGAYAGYSSKPLLLEFFPLLAVGSAFLLANVFDSKRDMRIVLVAVIAIAFGSAAFGYWVYSQVRTHVTGVYFSSVPGVVALLLFNLALRARAPLHSLAWLALSLPLFLHQFLSFGRGMWLGNIAGIVVSLLAFAVRRPGEGKWRRSAIVGGALLGAGVLGMVALTVVYGQADIILEAATRLATIGDTRHGKYETAATMARFIEYGVVIPLILKSPWIGHGLGYEFFVPVQLTGADKTAMQYWAHQNYLLVALKQGLVGLVLFLWMLWSAFWMGVRQSRRRDDALEASWLGAAAAGTAYYAVYSLTDFPFDTVQPMFLLALLWGVAMALARDGSWRIVWAAPGTPGDRVLAPVPKVPS